MSDFPRDTEVGVIFTPISNSHTGDENGMRGLLNISETQTITKMALREISAWAAIHYDLCVGGEENQIVNSLERTALSN